MERIMVKHYGQQVPEKLLHASSDIGIFSDCSSCGEVCKKFYKKGCSSYPIQEVFDRLAAYEDLEKQGKLMKLPCKVGDTLFVKNKNGLVAEAEVRDFSYFLTCGFCVVVTSKSFDKRHIPFTEFGKTVFLTAEEAFTGEKKERRAESVERLTEIFENGLHAAEAPLCTIIEKLGEYEDLEEQGKLVKLPCDVGDTVFVIPTKENSFFKIAKMKCIGFCIGEPNNTVNMFPVSGKETPVKLYQPDFADFGKTVFPTYQEAKNVWEQMKKKEGAHGQEKEQPETE